MASRRIRNDYSPEIQDLLESRDVLSSVLPLAGHSGHFFTTETYKIRTYQPLVAASDPHVFIPLDELKGTYKSLKGGLYPDGANIPTGELARMADQSTTQIQPLTKNGAVNLKSGSIGFLAIGQSTTRMCFEDFQVLAKSLKSPRVKLVNAAQDGVILQNWANDQSPWTKTLSSITKNGLSNKQIQVVWVESALIYPGNYGSGVEHIKVNADLMETVISRLKKEFPNVQLVYCSSRYYAGYTDRRTTPEPYAYESAFAIKELIGRQIAPGKSIFSNSASEKMPVVLWGPYYWVNGTKPSQTDGLTWQNTDCVPDGVHPSTSGRKKVAQQLVSFFTKDKNASSWFIARKTT